METWKQLKAKQTKILTKCSVLCIIYSARELQNINSWAWVDMNAFCKAVQLQLNFKSELMVFGVWMIVSCWRCANPSSKLCFTFCNVSVCIDSVYNENICVHFSSFFSNFRFLLRVIFIRSFLVPQKQQARTSQ